MSRVIGVSAASTFVILIGVSLVALMALPVRGRLDAARRRASIEAPLLGVVSEFEPAWLMDALRYAVGAVGALVLVQADQRANAGGLAADLLAGDQPPDPERCRRGCTRSRSTPYVAITIAAVLAFGLA